MQLSTCAGKALMICPQANTYFQHFAIAAFLKFGEVQNEWLQFITSQRLHLIPGAITACKVKCFATRGIVPKIVDGSFTV